MVVAHDRLHPQRARQRHLLHGGDPAVGGDQELGAALGEPRTVASLKPIPVAGAVGQVPVHARVELAQSANQHGGRAHAVDVVIAVDRDLTSIPRAVEDERRRVEQALELLQLVSLVARRNALAREGSA